MSLHIGLDAEIVEVGGRFSGRLWREPDADGATSTSKARAVRLSLQYRTEGRGSTDRKAVTTAEFAIDSHGGLNVQFELAVPADVPISYDGSLIRVRWEIEARIDRKFAVDPKTERAVVVVPAGGSGLYDRPHPLPSNASP